eukprot:jgi/Botrbrau1/21305/Bobra.0184s0016.1
MSEVLLAWCLVACTIASTNLVEARTLLQADPAIESPQIPDTVSRIPLDTTKLVSALPAAVDVNPTPTSSEDIKPTPTSSEDIKPTPTSSETVQVPAAAATCGDPIACAVSGFMQLIVAQEVMFQGIVTGALGLFENIFNSLPNLGQSTPQLASGNFASSTLAQPLSSSG